MRTVLLLTDAANARQQWTDVLGPDANVVCLPCPAEPAPGEFDVELRRWQPLVEAIVVDAAALGEVTVLVIKALGQLPLREHQAVVVRATATQCEMFPMDEHWLIVSDTDDTQQLRQSVATFFQLRDAQARLQQANTIIARHRQSPGDTGAARPATAPAYEVYRHREAVKHISRFMGECADQQALLTEFLRLLRELLGVGRLAFYMRDVRMDLFGSQPTTAGPLLVMAAGAGIPQAVGDHLRLTTSEGLGANLAREMRILQRARVSDPRAAEYDAQVAREFDLLGTEVAVPILDNDQLLGVLTFGGKITGDQVSADELELAYHLMAHLAQALRNLRLREQVQRQQSFMTEVLANVQSGVVVAGLEGRILSLNTRGRELLELGSQAVTGQRLSRLPGRVADLLFEVLETGVEVRQQEVAVARSNRPLSVSARRFTATGADGFVVVGLIEDLTQAKLQQAQARELADREFFTRLASRLSHELRNSLVAIKIYAQLLPERYKEKEFREQFSATVVTEINRVDVMVNNLTFFAHPLELVYESVDLIELMDSCCQRVAQEFARKQIAHVLPAGEKPAEGAPAAPVVTVKKLYGHKFSKLDADRIRLVQVFEQVMRNAVQAMPTGGRLTITTAPVADSDTVRIEWQDTGEGIPLENLRRITEPFFTTRTIGVGLGLTIVKKIVEHHGGRLEIDSLLGRGTTVAIVLPLKARSNSVDDLTPKMDDVGVPMGDADGGAVEQPENRLASRARTKRERSSGN